MKIMSAVYLQNLWFGGDVARIVGECNCPDGMFFDDDDMQCRPVPGFGILAILGIVIAAIVPCCCCVACCFLAKKMMSS